MKLVTAKRQMYIMKKIQVIAVSYTHLDVYKRQLKYSKDAVAIAKRLISEGADIVTDTNLSLIHI